MSSPHTHRPGLIATLTRHPLAANLLMLMLLLAGVWGLRQLNIQLNPTQPSDRVAVSLVWPGAAAEDIERLVTEPVEQQLLGLQDLRGLTSTTRDGQAEISLRFARDADMGEALDRVKQQIDQARDLPPDLEPPIVRLDRHLELVGAILLVGEGSLAELVPVARDIERDLLARGADQVEFSGVPREEIAIQVDSQTLFQLGVPLTDIARKVLEGSRDSAAGTLGSGQGERQLRGLEQARSVAAFEALPLALGDAGEHLHRLGDIALIERRQQDDQRLLYHEGQAAIMLRLRRAPESDVMAEADILRQWQADNAERLARQGVTATLWLEAWRFARDVLMLVVNNGLTGMLLVVCSLFLFLNLRVAGWVTLGIPVSFFGALALFWYLGGSINFISLIGAVMALGIVVDDAIVVGEHALARFEAGASPGEAAEQGARHMLGPVLASSLTTLAAFLPLVVIDAPVIREIPLLMVCVILASLVECFLIMPGHLRHSFERQRSHRPGRWRLAFDRRFQQFVERRFLPFLALALRHRRTVLAAAGGAFLVALSLLISGRVKTELDIQVNFEFAEAHVQFAARASDADKEAFLRLLERSLEETDAAFGGGLVVTHVRYRNWAELEQQAHSGSQYAAIDAELVSPEHRDVSLADFSAAWQARVGRHPLVERLEFSAGDDRYPDLQLYLSGGDLAGLKAAAEELASTLKGYPGVRQAFDDLPWGREQWLFTLNTTGRAAGLTSAELGRQVQAAYHGQRVQLFTEGGAELEVRVSLPASERLRPDSLRRLPITTPDGSVLPLAAVAELSARRGIERINHRDGQRVINVYAHVDKRVNTPMAIIADLEENTIPELTARHGVRYGLGEGSAEDARVLADMLLGAVIGLTLIYLILAWMFASWSWPLAVMAAIPLGLTGALAGLQIMGLNLGALAIMGLFTLTGVIINDSIILVTTWRQLRQSGLAPEAALLQACRARFRPVLLTSITTTLGLAPMMLESSPMGEAMAPLAVVICFGLLYGTGLILIAIPVLLSLLDRPREASADGHDSSPVPPTAPALTQS
jgi:multidrug efflux pump subunit AcrB